MMDLGENGPFGRHPGSSSYSQKQLFAFSHLLFEPNLLYVHCEVTQCDRIYWNVRNICADLTLINTLACCLWKALKGSR